MAVHRDSSSIPDRVPPQSVDLEMCVLGGIMLDPELAYPLAKTIITDQDFYLEGNALLFRLMGELFDKGTYPDMNVVLDELRSRELLNKVGGSGVVMGYLNSVPTAANVEVHCIKLKEKSNFRNLIVTCTKTINDCYAQQLTPDKIIYNIQQGISAVADGTARADEIYTLEDLAKQTGEDLITMFNGGGKRGITTGSNKLDQLTGGWQKGDLAIWSAQWGTGKSKIMFWSMMASALAGNKVGLISIDMNKYKLMKYLIPTAMVMTGRPGDPHRIFEPYAWNEEGQAFIRDECFNLDVGGNFLVVPRPRATSSMAIEGYVRKLVSEGCELIVIDQAQNFSDYRADEHGIIAGIVQKVKNWCWYYDIPIVLIHQVGRNGYLQGSSAFNQYPDTIIELKDVQQSLIDQHGCFVRDRMYYRAPTAKDDDDIERHYVVDYTRPIEIKVVKSREDRRETIEIEFDFVNGVKSR